VIGLLLELSEPSLISGLVWILWKVIALLPD